MIIRGESTLKAEQEELEISNENIGQISGASNYKEIFGLSYNNNYVNLIPNRFKWGRNLIKVID